MLVVTAVICSFLALLSGILAVGQGADWKFTVRDIWEGRQNAVLYVWVTFSSIFSLAHCAQLTTYGLNNEWDYANVDGPRWMLIHTSIALLLIAAHIFVRISLTQLKGREFYVWGPRCVHK